MSLYNSESERPLELIIIDLCGTITPKTKARYLYLMLMVDECTRFKWVTMLNRLPTNDMENLTPYEGLKGMKPKLDHLRVFVCVAYMKTTQPNQKKF